MSVFKKLKDVLFDIEEEEIPVITKEEKKAPIKKEEVVTTKEVNPIKEVKMPKEEVKPSSSFNFPLDDFDDVKPKSRVRDDYDDVFTPRRSPVMEPKKEERRMDYSKFLKEEPKRKEPSKPFKPTPIISPVYGILDQNYTKDDVIVKTDTGVKSPTLEDVRKKAYEKQKEEENKKVDDEFAEPLKTLDEILINNQNIKEEPEIEETPVEKVDKNVKLEKKIEVKEEEKVNVSDDDNKSEDDTLEKDLFNLIDSMYENKDEEEEE